MKAPKTSDGDISKYSYDNVLPTPKRVLVDFKELKQAIQYYAIDNCGGNFNAAVRELISFGLKKSAVKLNKQGKK